MTVQDHGVFTAPESFMPLHPTMGQGVAERTYLRRVFTEIQAEKLGGYGVLLNPDDPLFRKWYVAALNSGFMVDISEEHPVSAGEPDTRWENWAEVAQRVAVGSVSLLAAHRRELFHSTAMAEHREMADFIASGKLLMSGRHLQQGDVNQSQRNQEVFSNCAVSPTSFGLFTLLLNGAGVGRDYSDDMMAVDWANYMPTIVVVLDESHPDFDWRVHFSRRDARHLFRHSNAVWHEVSDSREGWGQAVETLETITFTNQTAFAEQRVATLILDFSAVRESGAPIMGMQGRPSSGPAPLMEAFVKIGRINGSGLDPWLATLYIDHYLAEPVLVGGARRSARMSTKWWQDEGIFEFIGVKRPIELAGMTREQVEAYLAEAASKPLSHLWSSNNSVTVDADFWARVNGPITADPLTLKAKAVYAHVAGCAYTDGTGEPGFINVDRLSANDEGLDAEAFISGRYMGSAKYHILDSTPDLLRDLYARFVLMPYHYITNPCGEIALSILGGFCVIADIVPSHCDTAEEALAVARCAVRALMRVNLMDSMFNAEVTRTNRIGVGLTGVHEAAWKFFRCGFRDLVNPDFEGYMNLHGTGVDPALSAIAAIRAAAFWAWLGRLGNAIREESVHYAETLGVAVPHTCTTIKPSGSVSKLYGLSEGWHLPAMRQYLRWVQYHKDSPMIADYQAKGYPTRELKSYKDHWIVGFPTEPAICTTDIGDKLVTAGEATMAEQFTWLMLGEFFYLEGGWVSAYVDTHGNVAELVSRRGAAWGNQISYTLKYRPGETSYATFERSLRLNQPHVRCVSVMPEGDRASYEYLPEEQVSVAEYQQVMAAIHRDADLSEDVGLEHLDCASGACPISFTSAPKESL